MLNWFSRLMKSRDLKSVVKETKKLKINGVRFEIRKLNPLDYADGSSALLQVYDYWKSGDHTKRQQAEVQAKKVKKHYIDVICAGCVRPQLSRKQNDGNKIWVEEVMQDWNMADTLYHQIMFHTYGKKKLIKYSLQRLS